MRNGRHRGRRRGLTDTRGTGRTRSQVNNCGGGAHWFTGGENPGLKMSRPERAVATRKRD